MGETTQCEVILPKGEMKGEITKMLFLLNSVFTSSYPFLKSFNITQEANHTWE